MCVPISIVTAGKVNGCQGVCGLWLHISCLVVLCAGLVLSFTRGFSFRKARGSKAKG